MALSYTQDEVVAVGAAIQGGVLTSFLEASKCHRVFRNELPRISEELANWCVANKVKMIGVEPPSIADVNNLDEVTKIHKILLKTVIIIEGLTNLEQLKSNCVELIALPLKIEDGDGSPARVIAIERQP